MHGLFQSLPICVAHERLLTKTIRYIHSWHQLILQWGIVAEIEKAELRMVSCWANRWKEKTRMIRWKVPREYIEGTLTNNDMESIGDKWQ